MGVDATAGTADDLRSMVREVLRDLLPTATSGTPGILPDTRGEEVVDLSDDADLAAFVDRLLQLTEAPEGREDLRTRRIRFHLAPPPRPPLPVTPAPSPPPSAPVQRIEKGAVTEAQVREAASRGARLVLGRRAVVTPLARDRARVLAVVIERDP